MKKLALCHNIPWNIGSIVSNEVSYEWYSRVEYNPEIDNEFPMCEWWVETGRFIAIIECDGKIISTYQLDKEIIISKQIQPYIKILKL
jgi:hypothetical protein